MSIQMRNVSKISVTFLRWVTMSWMSLANGVRAAWGYQAAA
jgi:hypothetical protein